jgi:hypothetical protein
VLICKLAGFPAPGRDVPVTVAFHTDGQGGEFWRRRFAGRRYASGFAAGTGRRAGLLRERFFPIDAEPAIAALGLGGVAIAMASPAAFFAAADDLFRKWRGGSVRLRHRR